jgi:hypothetical protein
MAGTSPAMTVRGVSDISLTREERPMTNACLIAWMTGETVALLILGTYRYVGSLFWMGVYNYLEIAVWPFSILGMMTGGGDRAADDQVIAVAVLLNGALYALLCAIGWTIFARRRSKA